MTWEYILPNLFTKDNLIFAFEWTIGLTLTAIAMLLVALTFMRLNKSLKSK